MDVRLKTKDDLIKEYNLDGIIFDKTICGNTAFTLQYIHFNLDLIAAYPDTFKKSLRAITCKQLLINTFSVLESIMFDFADTLKNSCYQIKECEVGCDFYFNDDTSKFIKFDRLRSYLKKIGALSFSENGRLFIEAAQELRNNVHVYKNKEIESENIAYRTDFVKHSLGVIREVIDVLIRFLDENSTCCLSGKYRRSI